MIKKPFLRYSLILAFLLLTSCGGEDIVRLDEDVEGITAHSNLGHYQLTDYFIGSTINTQTSTHYRGRHSIVGSTVMAKGDSTHYEMTRPFAFQEKHSTRLEEELNESDWR